MNALLSSSYRQNPSSSVTKHRLLNYQDMAFSLQRNLHIIAIFFLLCTFTYPAMSQTAYNHSSYYYSNKSGQSVSQYESSVYNDEIARARAEAAAAKAEARAEAAAAEAESRAEAAAAEAESRAEAAAAEAEARAAAAEAHYEESVAMAQKRWMVKYRRVYSNQTEQNKRFSIFKQNFEYINNFNSAGNSSYRLGLNQFADLTKEEFLASYVAFEGSRLTYSPQMATFSTSSLDNSDNGGPWKPANESHVPASMDWREKGAVTRPKDQHPCGLDAFHGDISNSGSVSTEIGQLNASIPCRYESLLSALGNSWAFSAVAAVEGLVKINTKKLTSLSEQQLMDCANNEEENQDNGENPIDNAFKYIIKNKGLAAENDYPYAGKMIGICDKKKANKSAANITGFVDVAPNSEEHLLQAVSKQPVSAAVAICEEMQFYSEGIYGGKCGSWLNHGVTVIGYGASDGMKFWLIKNSWGRSWGLNGYMMLQRDNGIAQGHCGIAMKASYPTA